VRDKVSHPWLVFSSVSKNEKRLYDHKLACVCVFCLCPLPTNNVWKYDKSIDAIIFNPIASTILKCLRIEFVRWSVLNIGLVLVTMGLASWLRHIVPWWPWPISDHGIQGMYFTLEQNRHKAISVFELRSIYAV
jgi:hypothetical protein